MINNEKGLRIYFTILGILVICLMFWAVLFMEPTPLVYWSTSSNECVEIHRYNKTTDMWEIYDCSDMPDTYEKVWVQ